MIRKYRSVLSSAVTPGENRIDMNPLLDVVFIMLIFFIVTAVFVREQGIDINPPMPGSATPPPPGENLLLKIGAQDTLQLAGRHVDVFSLSANLTRLHAQRPEAALVIDAHPASSVEVLVGVMDRSRAVGLTDIRFASR